MDRHVLWNTLLLQLLFSVCVCLHTRAPPLPSQISPPSGNAWEMPMSMSKCSLRVEPPELVVRFGDPVSVNCSYSQKTYLGWEGLPVAVEPVAVSFLPWTEKSLSHWSIKPQCFAVRDVDHCVVNLTVTVYQPPERVSLNFRNHTGALLEDPSGQLVEGHQYSLQCEVWAVAPAQNITVTFYRGHRELKVQTSRTSDKTPVNESFSLNYTVSREDHESHFWCEVKLELGPAGPQPPPVVRSENITVNIHVTEEQVEAPPTRSSTESSGRATVSAQSQRRQRQNPDKTGPTGAGLSLGSSALLLMAPLFTHTTQWL